MKRLVLLLLCLASSARAVETVTVVGPKEADRAMIETVVTQFVQLHAQRSQKSGLLVRQAGICPMAMGLPDAFDAFVVSRIREVAKQAGSAVEEAGKCRANVEVLFAADPQATVTALSEKTDGAILGFHFAHDKGPIIHVTRPIQAWYVTGTRGDPSSPDHLIAGDGTQDSSHGMKVDTAYGPSPDTGTGTHIRIKNGGQIVNVLVVVDQNRLAGREIGPIADYIAMLALSQARSLDGCNALPSILDLMSAGCGARAKPQALTDGDLAYLKALYAADIRTSGRMGEENVSKEMSQRVDALP